MGLRMGSVPARQAKQHLLAIMQSDRVASDKHSRRALCLRARALVRTSYQHPRDSRVERRKLAVGGVACSTAWVNSLNFWRVFNFHQTKKHTSHP